MIGHVAELADRFGSDVSYLPFRPVGKHADFNQENAIDSAIMHQVVQEIGNLRMAHPSITLLTYFDVLGEKATYHHSMDFNSPCPARKNGFIAFSGDFFPCDFLEIRIFVAMYSSRALRLSGETLLFFEDFKN
ncbi:MAG: hypothetical protein WCJ25_00300 [Candidatus Moraniibacteriota bacterium]